jgi:hypothetical protein
VYISALEGLIALAALGVFVFGPLQWVSTDAARQHLFSLRDQLFDIARAKRLDFASEEYRLIRSAFDRQIQFAHILSFWRLLVLARAATRLVKVPKAIDEAISRIKDDGARSEVEGLVTQMNQTVMLMMIAKSPILWVIVFLMLLVAVPIVIVQRVWRQRWRHPVQAAKEILAGKEALVKFSMKHFAPLIHEEAAALAY